jgi:branched-chain amino acid transport system ATP-binding protein
MLLDVKGLTKSFEGLVAVNNLDFYINRGEVLGMIGPNGAGKTTVFNLISGACSPDSGVIKFEGNEITGLKPHQICKKGIARTFQLTKPFLRMSVLQNVMVGVLFGRTGVKKMRGAEEEALKILELVGLSGKEYVPAKSLTTAERKRLEIARALATKPKLLLLDEVLAGLSLAEMIEVMELIREVNRSGITIFLTEHMVKVVTELSNRIIVLHHGVKVAEGKPEDVVKDERVIDVYMGGEAHA